MNKNLRNQQPHSVQEIISMGYPENEALLTNLMSTLTNGNSKEFSDAVDYLLSLGDSAIPHVKAALIKSLYQNDYGQWQSNILYTQVRHWNKEMVAEILPELMDLLDFGSDNWGVRLDVAKLLSSHQLINKEDLLSHIQRWQETLHRNLEELRNLETKLK